MSILDTFTILFENKGGAETKKTQDAVTDSAKKTGHAVEEAGKKGEKAAHKITEGNNKLAESFDKVKEHADEMAERLIEHALEVAAAFKALFAVEKLVDSVFETAETSDQLGERAKSLGVEVEELDAWGNAAKRVGGSAEAFGQSLVDLNRNVSRFEATGKGRLLPFLKELGLGTDVLKLKFTELLPALAKATEGKDKQQTSGALRGLGLDEGTIRLLQRGKEGVEALIARQKQLGLTTAEDAEAAEKFNIEWDDIQQMFHHLMVEFDTYFLPTLERLLDGVEAITRFLEDHANVVKGFFIGLGVAVIALADAFDVLNIAMLKNPVVLITAAIIAAIAAFALLYDDIVAFAKGGNSVIGHIAKQWPIVGKIAWEIIDAFRALRDFTVDAFTDILQWIEHIPEGFRQWGEILSGLYAKFEEFFPGITGLIEDTSGALGINLKIWEGWFNAWFVAAKFTVETFWNVTKAIFELLANIIVNPQHAFEKFGASMKQVFQSFGSIGEGVIALWQKIGDIITSTIGRVQAAIGGISGALHVGGNVFGEVKTFLHDRFIHSTYGGALLPDLPAAHAALADSNVPASALSPGAILAGVHAGAGGANVTNNVTVQGSTINATSAEPAAIGAAVDATVGKHISTALNHYADGVSH